ncbi:MAG: isoprenylcysteine carboxylmethyltransferase family protein [Verrucomicrobiales bacterium]|nr:isoprenylcysteine carboxylmethyltransferase family protein [Verrucomicrobiales bacterium]
MVTSRFFEWFQFGALTCWALLGLTRAIQCHMRGGRVFAADRERTLSQKAVDILAFACLLAWAYEIVAYAWPFRFHIGPRFLGNVLVDGIAIKILGAVLVSLATLLYAIALRHLGASWRLGIDRIAPGQLVTEGIYRWTRHPIYVAFDLLFAGTFLVLGRFAFLLLALAWIPLLHVFMLREEHFLAQFHGAAYRDYCRRVGRYFPRPRNCREPNGS